jgi:hypothetical protein
LPDLIVSENVRDWLRLDQRVFDRQNTSIGTVDAFDHGTGWMMVGTDRLNERALYVPFRLIASIDPRELYLSATRAELERDYRQPPARSTTVRGEDEQALATTVEPSGYDGAPLIVKQTRLDLVADRIARGDRVLTADGTGLGVIKDYDRATGVMCVERGSLVRHTLRLPIRIVDHVERAIGEVHLVVREADLPRASEAQADASPQ